MPGTVAVTTRHGLWASRDGGASWTRNVALPAPDPRGLTCAGSEVVVADTQAGVFVSTDLHDWRRVLPTADRLSPSADGQAAFSLGGDDPSSRTAYVIQRTGARAVAVPLAALRAAGLPGGPLLVQSSGVLAISPDGGATWRTAAQGSFASLAVSPAFPQDGVVLMGGFRTGILRSADGGHTWNTVLANPAALVPGSDAAGVAFLSATQAVCINPAFFTWQPA